MFLTGLTKADKKKHEDSCQIMKRRTLRQNHWSDPSVPKTPPKWGSYDSKLTELGLLTLYVKLDHE